MDRLTVSALLGACAFLGTSVANAADWPEPGPPPQVVQEFFSNWYLRGDVGYRFNAISGGTAFGNAFTSSSLRDAAVIGGGVGLRAGWFRSDITVDYGSQPKFTGATVLASPAVTAGITSVLALVNGYVDLGTWWGLTPYLGAGIGASQLRPAGVSAAVPAGTPLANPGNWMFAWAGIVGTSYALSPNLLLDANYRYVDLGAARTTSPLGEIHYGHQTGHEVRLGFRYLID